MNPQEKLRIKEEGIVHRLPDGELKVETLKSRHEFSFPLSFQRDIQATVTISGSGKLKRRDLEVLQKKVAVLLEGFEEEEQPSESVIRLATWKNKDHDQPVTVTGELGERDGKKYYSIRETSTGIPEDELEFE